MARIGRFQHRGARYGGPRVARVVIAALRVLQRVEHLGAVGDRAAEDAGAVAIDVGADRAAVEAEQRLVRQDQRDRVVVGGAAGRGAGLLAEARHHQIGADRHGRARARAERCGAGRVVHVGRIAAPAAALVAEDRGQSLFRHVPAAGVAGAAVVFGAYRLGEDDRALVAQLLDEDVVARRKIDVVIGVAAAGRAHVPGVERVLEREDDAIHRHRVEIGVAAVGGVELGGAFERVGMTAELFAHRRRAGWQRALGGVPVELALAGHRTLAADVERRQRVEPARHRPCRRSSRIAALRRDRKRSPPFGRIRAAGRCICRDPGTALPPLRSRSESAAPRRPAPRPVPRERQRRLR